MLIASSTTAAATSAATTAGASCIDTWKTAITWNVRRTSRGSTSRWSTWRSRWGCTWCWTCAIGVTPCLNCQWNQHKGLSYWYLSLTQRMSPAVSAARAPGCWSTITRLMIAHYMRQNSVVLTQVVSVCLFLDPLGILHHRRSSKVALYTLSLDQAPMPLMSHRALKSFLNAPYNQLRI